MMSMADLLALGMETLRIDNGCSLEKKCIELIRMNSLMVLCKIFNQVDSCHGCVHGSSIEKLKTSYRGMIIF